MNEPSYYLDPGRSEFEACVLEIIKDKHDCRVLLDQTYFFPGGGGQPADRGWIDDIPVLDVKKEAGHIYHYLAAAPGSPRIKARIDMSRRHDYMQQHTGQHIISAALWRVGKFKTVSVHMGSDLTTIEIDAATITPGDLAASQDLANRAVCDNIPIRCIYTTTERLGEFSLRKPPTVAGTVRLVQIGDFDCVGCGGLHLDRSGRVGLVKALDIEKIRGRVRIAWAIGDRAYADYEKKARVCRELRTLLATSEDDFAAKAGELQQELSDCKKRYGSLENRLSILMAQELFRGRRVTSSSAADVIVASWQGEDERLLKKVVKVLLKKENLLICLVNRSPQKLTWSIGCSENLDYSFEAAKGALLEIIDGTGGGRHPLWQGAGKRPDKCGEFLAAFATQKFVSGR